MGKLFAADKTVNLITTYSSKTNQQVNIPIGETLCASWPREIINSRGKSVEVEPQVLYTDRPHTTLGLFCRQL